MGFSKKGTLGNPKVMVGSLGSCNQHCYILLPNHMAQFHKYSKRCLYEGTIAHSTFILFVLEDPHF